MTLEEQSLSFEDEWNRMVEGDEDAPVLEEPITPVVEELESPDPIEEPVVVEEILPEPEPAPPAIDWEQKYKSYQGIADQEMARLRSELEAIRADMSKQPDVSPVVEASVDEDVDQFWRDYPDLKKPLTAIITSIVNDAVTDVKAMIEPLNHTVQQSEQDRFVEAIASHHSDWYIVIDSAEFNHWLNALPFTHRSAASSVLEHGTAQQVVELLDEYKASKAPAVAPKQQPVAPPVVPSTPVHDPTIDKLKAALTVESQAPVHIPTHPDDGNTKDMSEYFNELC